MKEVLHRYMGLLFDLNGTMIDDMAYHVEAAANADMNCFVLTTLHSPMSLVNIPISSAFCRIIPRSCKGSKNKCKKDT